jgi:site-specific recombinase XerC
MERSAIPRRIDRSAGQAEGWQVPLCTDAPELVTEFKRYPVILGEDRIFPPEPGAKRDRQRVDKSFETILESAGIEDFRFHDLRHTFASWYLMNGGDLYELAKILGHSNIKMTERYAKLGKSHIAKTGSTAREMGRLMEGARRDRFGEAVECSLMVPLTETLCHWLLVSY